MGSSASKVSRKFPQRQKLPDVNKMYDPVKDLGQYKLDNTPASNRPDPQVAQSRDGRIEVDGKDPQLLEMLRKAGPVQYNASKAPDLTSARTTDPLRTMYENRKRLGQESAAEEESASPRKYIEISEIVGILNARKEGIEDADIVRQFNLDSTVLNRLGRNVNTPTQSGEKDDHGNSKAIWVDKV